MRQLLILIFGYTVHSANASDITIHENPDSGLLTYTYVDEGFTIELIQLAPDFVRAIYSNHGFPKREIDDIASYCVFGSILKNTSDKTMHYRVADWRYKQYGRTYPIKTKTEWLEQWRKAGITFSWTLLPDEGDFFVGDWQQGFTTIKLARDSKFDILFRWKLDDIEHSGTLEQIQCPPAEIKTEQVQPSP